MIVPSAEISNRTDFSILCNARGLKEVAVEIGTDRAVFASDFLSRWQGRELLCVDPYTAYDEMSHTRECDRKMAVLALQRFWPRVRMFEVPSPDAIRCIMPWHHPIEFIYIDGSHLYENARRDIAAWWPMLADNGILAGHDYDEDHPGVMRAVQEFAEAGNCVVRVTGEKNPSWYAYKTEPAALIQRYFSQGDTVNPYA